ncbi:hexosaminidase D [Salminus brasiliensis]|uniref:hexosaminidase D n=1 Tax=Salminus brasiliensis TaxID=930266 RepID=UPI003B839BF7
MHHHMWLRLLVLSLGILAMMKLFYSSGKGPGKRNQNMEIVNSNHFWKIGFGSDHNSLDPPGGAQEAKENQGHQLIDHQEEGLNLEDEGIDFIKAQEKKEIEALEEEEEEEEEEIEIIRAPEDTHKGPLRVVHLDLKGAAPKVKYLKQIFPLLSSLGADGILLEYEDMFPYEGELKILRSPFAYSVEDIEEIKTMANLSNLELIPLVQVFGHLEFVLKHEKFDHLREVAAFPTSLNPTAPGALELIKKMLMQVLKRHPRARWFHIGADEVYGLGESEDSKHWMEKNGGDVGALYLMHLSAICSAVTEVRPGIKLLFWEDMLRKFSVSTIQNSGLPKLAYPMIWNYSPKVDVNGVGNLIGKYQEAGFTGVWFASAFKGASGIAQRWTPINMHLQNHIGWLKVIDSMTKFPSIKYLGIALTGWQRFEHFTVLCELLPVGIPSLAVCLQTLKYGSFNEEAENAVHQILGCKIQMDANNCDGSGAFAGSEVYHTVRKINSELQASIQNIKANHFVQGSLSTYHRKYNFANPRNIAFCINALKKLLEDWESVLEAFRTEMEAIFYPDTVEEWMEENVNEHLTELHAMVQGAEHLNSLKGRPKSLKES